MSLPEGFVLDQAPSVPQGFVLDRPIQKLNRTPADESWRQNLPDQIGMPTPKTLLQRAQGTKLGAAIFGPEYQGPGMVQGLLPQISQYLFGNIKPEAAKGAGLLTISPAHLIPGEPEGKAAFADEMLRQVNLQNIGLLKGLTALRGVEGHNVLKAALGTAFASQMAGQAGEAIGNLSVTGLPPIALGPELPPGIFNLHRTSPLGTILPGEERTQGTTEQWRNLADALLSTAGALGGPFMFAKGPTPLSDVGPRDIMSRVQWGDIVPPIPTGEAARIPVLHEVEGVWPPKVERENLFATPVFGEKRVPGPPLITPESLQAQRTVIPETKPMPKEGLAGQISFEGEGIPSARQAAEMVPENVLKSREQLSGKKIYGGAGVPLEPEEIAKELGFIYKEWPTGVPIVGGKGSYTDPKTGLTIENIARGTPIGEIARRMSEKTGEQYAIRKLRTDQLDETQQAGPLPKVEEEVRGRATEEGEVRQKEPQLLKVFEESKYATPELRQQFAAIHNQQRWQGPESMFERHANPNVDHGTGIWQTSLEHGGDLVHRLSYSGTSGDFGGGGTFYGRGAALEKAERLLRMYTEEYGIDRDVREQIGRNYKYDVENRHYQGTEAQYRQEVIDAGERYAREYEKIQPVTEVQKLGRDVAIDTGRFNFSAATVKLKRLIEILKRPNWEQAYWTPLKKTGASRRYGGAPLFDPEMWGMSKEEIRKVKDTVAVALNIGKKEPPSPEAVAPLRTPVTKPLSARAQRIYDNPNANPFVKRAKVVAQPGEALPFSQQVKNAFVPYVNALSKIDKILNPWDVVFDWLDGGKAHFKGPLIQEIRIPFDEKFNLEANMMDALTSPLKEIVKRNKLGPREEQRIGVYLHAMQENGVQRMIASGVKPEIIDNIVKTISPKELEYVEAWRKVESVLGPEILRVAKAADKVDVKLVQNYFPWMRDFDKYVPDADEVATNPKLQNKTVTAADALWPGLPIEVGARKKPGSLISRVEGAETPIRFDTFSVAERYIRDATHYVSSRELVKETAKIVRDDKFRQTYGDLGQKLVMDFVNTYARQGRYKKNRVIDALKRNIGRSVIGARLPSQFVHMANIPLAQKQAGILWWNKGLDEALSEGGRAFLKENFKETFMRGGGEPVQAEISAQQARTTLGRGFNNVSRYSFAVMRYIDMLNSQATTLGVYMRLLQEKGLDPTRYKELPVDKALVGEARIRARRAVASPIYKDVPPALSAGGSLSRSFFQFQNVFLDQYSNLRYEAIQTGIPQAIHGNPKELMATMGALLAMLMAETTIKYSYKEAVKTIAGTKKEDDNEFTKELLQESLKRAPGVGQLQSGLTYGGVGVPVLDVPLGIGREARRAATSTGGSRIVSGTRALGSALELTGVPGISQALDIGTALERRKLFKEHTERLQEETGKPVEQMSLDERIEAEYQYRQKQPPQPESEKAKSAERAIANISKRSEELTKSFDKKTRAWLESRNLTVPGYDNKLKMAGQIIYLTDEETKRLGEHVKSEYLSTIKELQSDRSFLSAPTEERKVMFNDAMLNARTSARALMVDELDQRNKAARRQRTPRGRRAPTSEYSVGQTITRGGQKWTVTGFDKDGMPLVEKAP